MPQSNTPPSWRFSLTSKCARVPDSKLSYPLPYGIYSHCDTLNSSVCTAVTIEIFCHVNQLFSQVQNVGVTLSPRLSRATFHEPQTQLPEAQSTMCGVVLSLGVRDQAPRHGRPLRLYEHGPGPSHQKKASYIRPSQRRLPNCRAQPSPRWRRPC